VRRALALTVALAVVASLVYYLWVYAPTRQGATTPLPTPPTTPTAEVATTTPTTTTPITTTPVATPTPTTSVTVLPTTTAAPAVLLPILQEEALHLGVDIQYEVR
jgi:hypothetical protein